MFRNLGRRVKQFSRHLLAWKPDAQVHFSQEGEDILLQRIFANQSHGFYVDIGAHDPFRFSNTHWAYRQGWSGVNVDPSPNFSRRFNKYRPRDINVNLCVSETSEVKPFFVFPVQALSTAVETRKEQVESMSGSESEIIHVRAQPLRRILEDHVPPSIQTIDLMSIDVEGAEMAALRSNDWERFKPRVLVMEILGRTLANLDDSAELAFVRDVGFTPVAMLYHSVILVSDSEILSEHWPVNGIEKS